MGLNETRLVYIRKGYVNQRELAIFLGVGRAKGRQIYNQIVDEIESGGHRIDGLGIRISYLLEFLNLDECDIRRFAEDESKEELNND